MNPEKRLEKSVAPLRDLQQMLSRKVPTSSEQSILDHSTDRLLGAAMTFATSIMSQTEDGEERWQAIVKVREAVFWAVAGLARTEDPHQGTRAYRWKNGE